MNPLIAVAVALGLALAAPALAQNAPNPHAQHHDGQAKPKAPPPGQRGGMMDRKGMGMGVMQGRGMQGMPMAPGTHLEGRLAFLRAELGITDAQAPQWNAFADAVRKATKAMTASMPMMQAKTVDGSWIDGLERHEKLMASHLEGLRTIRSAAQLLYAALGEEQQRTADDLLPGPMGPMGGMPLGGMAGMRM